MALFSRICTIEDEDGNPSPLEIAFHVPERTGEDEYVSKATLSCRHFESRVLSIGSDAAQSFFSLPKTTTSALIGLRRYGYEVYWFERGDLDCADFWTYRQ